MQPELDRLAWYHTIDVAPGVTTKGLFDLRHALPLMPFPDVRGKRCLDIGTWDGFYAYELERRGAAEVVALDVTDLSTLDYPPDVPPHQREHSGEQARSEGFRTLHAALESTVRFTPGSIYDIDTLGLGTFDLVVIGSLLVHLRDPVRALDSVRRVTGAHLLTVDYVHAPLVALSKRRPLFELRGETADFQWWLPNDAGARHLLRVGGFEVERASKPFLLRPGPALPKAKEGAKARFLNLTLTGDRTPGGHLHRAYLARPRW